MEQMCLLQAGTVWTELTVKLLLTSLRSLDCFLCSGVEHLVWSGVSTRSLGTRGLYHTAAISEGLRDSLAVVNVKQLGSLATSPIFTTRVTPETKERFVAMARQHGANGI